MQLLLLLLLFGETLVQADGVPVHYYVDFPTGKARAPLVAILQGSECRKVADKYGSFIEQFNQRGIGVLRVEKPGLGPDTPIGECPLTYLQRNTLERRVWDLLAIMGELRKRADWDGRLVLLGGSEGAMLAGLTAPLIPETQAVVILSGGGGLTFREEILEMMRKLGAPPSQLEGFDRLCEEVHREPTTTQEWGSDGKLARNTHLWLSRAEDLAIWRPLLQVGVPILVVHGARDESTPLQSAQKLEQIFREAGKTNLTLRIEPNDGHAPSEASLKATLEWIYHQGLKL